MKYLAMPGIGLLLAIVLVASHLDQVKSAVHILDERVAMLEDSARVGAAILSTATTDTIETFRTNVNSSLSSLNGTLAATTSSNTWSGLQAFTNASSTLFSVGSAGTTLAGVNFGSCAIWAAANTIAASSSVQVDCGGGTSKTALPGISAGDTIEAWATTTMSTAFAGIFIKSVAASSTAGYITLYLFNGTGATFTWTSVASSTIRYHAFR